MGKKVYLVEKIEHDDGGTAFHVVGEYDTTRDALNQFDTDLEGGYLGAPNLTDYPEAYLIEGKKIPIIIKKKGVID